MNSSFNRQWTRHRHRRSLGSAQCRRSGFVSNKYLTDRSTVWWSSIQAFGIKTTGLEEKASACSMLVCYAKELKQGFVDYVEQTTKLMVPLLRFYFHEGLIFYFVFFLMISFMKIVDWRSSCCCRWILAASTRLCSTERRWLSSTNVALHEQGTFQGNWNRARSRSSRRIVLFVGQSKNSRAVRNLIRLELSDFSASKPWGRLVSQMMN